MRPSIAGLGLAASIVLLACFAGEARGQSTSETMEQLRAQQMEAARRDARRRELERAMDEVTRRRTMANRRPSLPIPKRKMTEEHKRLLFPSDGEREAFAAFLRQPNTGIVRLLPQSDCREDPRLLHANGSCVDAIPPVPGGGSFYSFRSGGHQWGQRADVWLRDGIFRAGFAGESLGFLTALGDVPLDAVTLGSAGVDYLAEFAPPTSLDGAQRQYEMNKVGFRVRNHVYGAAMYVRPAMTYVLRSITYRADNEQSKMRKPADVLVSFRVVSRASDGSVTLVWKELQRRKSPKLQDVNDGGRRGGR
ncbi:MAG TPA: hypothetical protein VK363_11510 [Pyrinomonadaceae bacterium]|nr:hypothetical protein [Pyrinomonadaceae bacterium]